MGISEEEVIVRMGQSEIDNKVLQILLENGLGKFTEEPTDILNKVIQRIKSPSCASPAQQERVRELEKSFKAVKDILLQFPE